MVEDADLELAGRLARQVFRLIRNMDRIKAQAAALRGDKIERACIGLLVELADRGPMRTTELANAVLADPSTVSRQVAQLIDLGYVERQPDPKDGRASHLAATEEGLARLADGWRRGNQMFEHVLADWMVADRQQLVDLIERLNDTLETHRPQARAEQETL